ncbi:MAG TPA: thiamine pyrophosphate-dependent enzyme [Planctomycetota bacterium]|nr:thiamine pyrophosphate-dependent enzyme [Planctomycetota bacterium]
MTVPSPTVNAEAETAALLAHLERMALIRAFDRRVMDLVTERKVHGTCHGCIGQEATAVGVVSCLRHGDTVTSTHRGHGHFLAMIDNPDGLMAEIMGRRTGICKGWGGTQHLQQDRFFSNGITGGMMPNATGMALAVRLAAEVAAGRTARSSSVSGRSRAIKPDSLVGGSTGGTGGAGSDLNVVCAFLGDGTLGQGVFYESMNEASLWNLPIVYVLENNGYAMSTPNAMAIAGDMAMRGKAFGLGTQELLVDDFRAVQKVAREAIVRARGGRPQLLVLHTYRFCGHSKSDDLSYRTREEEALWKTRDPLEKLAAELGAAGAAAVARAEKRIADAAAKADQAPPGSLIDQPVIAWVKDAAARPTGFRHALPAQNEIVTYAKSIARGIGELLAQDDRVYLIGEDIADPYGGAFRLSQGLSTQYPGRVRNTPISEPSLIGLGAGLALSGYRPIVEIMFGDFLGLTFDQIVNHAAKFRGMWGGNVKVPLTIRAPMGARRGYGATHSQTLEKHLLGVPGLKIIAPSHLIDAGALLQTCVYDDNVTLFIENKLLYGRPLLKAGQGDAEAFAMETGSGEYPVSTLSTGEFEEAQATILLYGGMLPFAMEAAVQALEQEIYVDIVVPTRLDEVDLPALKNSLARSGRLIIVEESIGEWGWGAEWAARAAAELSGVGGVLRRPVERLAAVRAPIGAAREIETEQLVQTGGILAALVKT